MTEIDALRAEFASYQERARAEVDEAHALAQAACMDTGAALKKLAHANERIAKLERAIRSWCDCEPCGGCAVHIEMLGEALAP